MGTQLRAQAPSFFLEYKRISLPSLARKSTMKAIRESCQVVRQGPFQAEERCQEHSRVERLAGMARVS